MSTDNTITKTDLKNILEEVGSIGGSVDSTSTPTASKVSKFDSSAKMNSTDMDSTEIDNFVAGLNVSGGDGLTDISSSFTINSTYVSAFRAYTDGRFVYVKFTSKGAPDQTNVVTNIASDYRPPSCSDNYFPLSCFFMNATDFSRNTNVAVMTSTIQLRCSTASQGSGGIIIGGMYPLANALA